MADSSATMKCTANFSITIPTRLTLFRVVARRIEAQKTYRAKVAVANFHDGNPAENYGPYIEWLMAKVRQESRESEGLQTIWHDRCYPGAPHDYSEKGYRLRVKQFAPMIQYDEGDYGCEWRWAHYGGRGYESRWDIIA